MLAAVLNSLATSSRLGNGLIIFGIVVGLGWLQSFPYENVMQATVLVLSGVFWTRCVKRFENALRDEGIYQTWSTNEPSPPYAAKGLVPEPSQRRFFGDFSSYDYAGSDLMGGVSHVQCHVCHKWSVFPFLHVDGMAYWEKEMGIHRAICHFGLREQEKKFEDDYIEPFRKRLDEALEEQSVAWRVSIALEEAAPQSVETKKAGEAYDQATEAYERANDKYHAALDAVERAQAGGLTSVPDQYLQEALEARKKSGLETRSRLLIQTFEPEVGCALSFGLRHRQ
jgi:hypothetical protein